MYSKALKKKLFRTLFPLGVGLFTIFFISNFALVYYIVKFKILAQSCLTVSQVSSDSRCLYIYANKVYEKGSRSSPHHDNPCGTDVTSIIPSFHFENMAKYLDPNFRADICTSTPSPSPTPVPTATATATPSPSPTPIKTASPTPVPTATPTSSPALGGASSTPTASPTATKTATPTASPVATRTPTPTPQIVGSQTATPIPTNNDTVNSTGVVESTPLENQVTTSPSETSTPLTTSITDAPGKTFFARLSGLQWWGVVLAISAFLSFLLTGLITVIYTHRSTITSLFAKKGLDQIVLSGFKEGEEISNEVFYAEHTSSQTAWIELGNKRGVIWGYAPHVSITEGIGTFSGVIKKHPQADMLFIEISAFSQEKPVSTH